LLSGAGNVQVIVAAVGFTTMFFIIVALAGALFLGYGRRPERSPAAKAAVVARAGGRPVQPVGPVRPVRPIRGMEPAAEPKRAGRQPKGHGKFGVSRRRDAITVEVNPNRCARFGFCEHEAPDVFYLESDGRFGYQATVPVAKMDRVISAMEICPRRAIKVKLPPEHAQSWARPEEVPEVNQRVILPLVAVRHPDDDAPRRA
jgi:ferredoxin